MDQGPFGSTEASAEGCNGAFAEPPAVHTHCLQAQQLLSLLTDDTTDLIQPRECPESANWEQTQA